MKIKFWGDKQIVGCNLIRMLLAVVVVMIFCSVFKGDIGTGLYETEAAADTQYRQNTTDGNTDYKYLISSCTPYLTEQYNDVNDMRKSVFAVLFDIIIVVVGIFLILVWKIDGINKKYMYLGQLAVFVGCWCINKSALAVVLIQNYYISNCISLVFAVLIVAALIGYVKLLVTLIKVKSEQHVKISLVGIVLFIITIITFVIFNRKNITEYNDLFNVLICLLFCVCAIGVRRELKEKITEVGKFRLYREMALKDMQTGLYNRNAFDKCTNKINESNVVCIFVFDINDLKLCNDSYGHYVGDRLITQSARLIESVFGEEAAHFRIGGDEFCTVLTNINAEYAESKKNQIKEKQRERTIEGTKLKLSMACGYAFYDKMRDENLEMTRKRADISMYQDKESMKKGKIHK